MRISDWSSDVCSSDLTAIALTERLQNKALACDASKDQRAQEIQAEKAAWEKELDEWTHEKDSFSLDMIEEQNKESGNYLHPRQVLRELEKAIDRKSTRLNSSH